MSTAPSHDTVVSVLGYVVPLLVRLRTNRDALATGRVPLAHQTLFRSPAAQVDDRLSVNEGAAPSALGQSLSHALSSAEQDATDWALKRLAEHGLEPDDAAEMLEQQIAWHLAASISFDEIQAINQAQLSPPIR